MKKYIITALFLLSAATIQTSAAQQSPRAEYRTEFLKFLELSGTIDTANEMIDLMLRKYGDEVGVNRKDYKIIEMLKEETSELFVIMLEPSYKRYVSLKDLKKYNRKLRNPAIRKVMNARADIYIDIATDIKSWGKKLERHIKNRVEELEDSLSEYDDYPPYEDKENEVTIEFTPPVIMAE